MTPQEQNDYQQEYETRKYNYQILLENGITECLYLTESEYDVWVKDITTVSVKRMTDAELYQSLNDSIDVEEIKRRNAFSCKKQNEQAERKEANRYLKSGY